MIRVIGTGYPPELKDYIVSLAWHQHLRDLKQNTQINLLLREVKDYTKLKKIWGAPISYSSCPACRVWKPDHCRLAGFILFPSYPFTRTYLGHSFTNATKRIKRAIKAKTHPSPPYESDSDSDTSSAEYDNDSEPSSTDCDSDFSEDPLRYEPNLDIVMLMGDYR